LYEETKNDPIKKSELIKEIVESIALMPNAITRTVFIQECSKIMKMDEQSLLTELNKALRKRYSKRNDALPVEDVIEFDTVPVPQPIDTNRDTSEHHEKEIVRLLLNHGNKTLEMQTEETDADGKTTTSTETISVAKFIVEHLVVDNISFEHALYAKIFAEYSGEEIPSIEHFIHHEDPEIASAAVDLTTFPYSISDWKLKHDINVPKEDDILKVAVEHTIYSLKIRKIVQMINEIQKEIEHAENEEDMLTLVAKKKMLDQAKNAFSKELKWVVTR
jgi:DNA primase